MQVKTMRAYHVMRIMSKSRNKQEKKRNKHKTKTEKKKQEVRREESKTGGSGKHFSCLPLPIQKPFSMSTLNSHDHH